MKRASLDVGTNSVRLLIAEYKNGAFLNSEKYVQITQLGKGVNETKILEKDRIEATIDAIESFNNLALNKGCSEVRIMATSAVRDARNREAFIEAVRLKTGLIVEVISGGMEAEIGFKGVLAGVQKFSGQKLVIDIGGGSTELIIGDEEGIAFSVSIDIGAVRLTGAFVDKDPVDFEICDSIKAYAKEKLLPHLSELELYKLGSAIGIGGTAASFITMIHEISKYSRDRVHNASVSLRAIKTLNQKLAALSVSERKSLVGLEEKRAEVILAGGLILECILESLQIESLIFSDYDNLEGFMIHSL